MVFMEDFFVIFPAALTANLKLNCLECRSMRYVLTTALLIVVSTCRNITEDLGQIVS